MTLFRGSGDVGSGEQVDYLRSSNNLSDVDNVPEARQNLGLESLSSISGLTPTDSAFIVGDGVNWVAESGLTARTSLGLNNVVNTDTSDAANISFTDTTSSYLGTDVEAALNETASLETYSDLKTVSSTQPRIVGGRSSLGDGGEGIFYWDSSNLSTQVSNDEVTTGEGDGGIYVAPDSDKTGASGAWVRFTSADNEARLEWYGTSTEPQTALSSAFSNVDLVRVGNYQWEVSVEPELPANKTLIGENGSTFNVTDNTIRSCMNISGNNAYLEGITLILPTSLAAGTTGLGVWIEGNSGITLKNVRTENGRVAYHIVDTDDLTMEGCTCENSDGWGIALGSVQNGYIKDCHVLSTIGASSDAIKVTGSGGFGTASRNTFNLVFENCSGRNASTGSSFDINSQNDVTDDVNGIYLNNCWGETCDAGFLEIKTAASFTNWSLRSVFIDGGHYYGDGTETDAVIRADRKVTSLWVNDFSASRGLVGFQIASSNEPREITFRNCVASEMSQEGFKILGGSFISLIECSVVDANYGQASSTYSAFNINDGISIVIDTPSVIKTANNTDPEPVHGIDISSNVGTVTFEGTCSIRQDAVATNQINNNSNRTVWPTVLVRHGYDPTATGSQEQKALGTISGRFLVGKVSLIYEEATNFVRDFRFFTRDNSSTTQHGGTLQSSGSASQWDKEDAQVQNISSSAFGENTVTCVIDPVTLPGSPTGIVSLIVEGIYETRES